MVSETVFNRSRLNHLISHFNWPDIDDLAIIKVDRKEELKQNKRTKQKKTTKKQSVTIL